MDFGMRKTVLLGFEEAKEKLEKELKNEGFDVMVDIDMKATLMQKLDIYFRNYTILGVCLPKLAKQALDLEEEFGLLLPINVLVYENSDGQTIICALSTEPVSALFPSITDLAKEFGGKLMSAINKV